jgi:hypothetical protein
MNREIWGRAIAVPVIVAVVSFVIFAFIAWSTYALYPNSLAYGTFLFIVFSAGAWFLAQRTEKEHAANNPEQSADEH